MLSLLPSLMPRAFRRAAKRCWFRLPMMRRVFSFSMSAILSQLEMRDIVPSTLTTMGPRASSLTVVPEPLTSMVVTFSLFEPGAGRALRDEDSVEEVDEDELSLGEFMVGDDDEKGEMRERGTRGLRKVKMLRRSIDSLMIDEIGVLYKRIKRYCFANGLISLAV